MRIAFNRGKIFRAFISGARKEGRKIIFATQGHCLVPNAESLFFNGNEKINAYFLPNPIPKIDVCQINKTNKPSFVLLGRLDPIKRFWIFFELAKYFPEALFYVLGEPHKPELAEPIISKYRYLENLIFLDKVEGTEKYKILSGAWALINTSIHEAIPVSFLESLSVKTPIISCLNPDDLVSKYGIHTKFVRGDGLDSVTMESFKSALNSLRKQPEYYWQKASEGQSYVRQTHSFENFENILRDICLKEGVPLKL